jgi:molybdopterin-guanine dinucleotide biosynthesis protein A
VPQHDLGGYVLAGGRSSRMGQDKALLEIGGQTLAERATSKLRSICRDVHILSRNPTLARFAPLIEDRHPDCGPLGGIEAALAHTTHEWNLILPVDLPFLPAEFLQVWVSRVLEATASSLVISMFSVHAVAQPTLLMVRRVMLPELSRALAEGRHKLSPALIDSARSLLNSADGASPGYLIEELEHDPYVKEMDRVMIQVDGPRTTPYEMLDLWFANVNTPEEFALACRQADAVGSVS